MYQVTWLVRNHVMLVRAEGDVTVAELRSGISLKHVMLTDVTVAKHVHCLFDNRHLNSLPLDPEMRLKLSQSEDEHGGWTIHIQDNPMSRRLTDLTTSFLSRRNTKTLRSVEEALNFLKTQDSRLQILLSPTYKHL